jgi:hypothetical protein
MLDLVAGADAAVAQDTGLMIDGDDGRGEVGMPPCVASASRSPLAEKGLG